MCGLAGLLDPTTTRSGDDLVQLAGSMADQLKHRGPDDRGVWADERSGLGFGHRRLSVVDLSPAGRQPMTSADGRWVIVYNGEIYNTDELRSRLGRSRGEFRGHSDTEVLLEVISARGVAEAVEMAVGMFALVTWDRERRELWMARDRFGEKPLYFANHGSTLLFGSELKALKVIPGFSPEVDPDSLSELLRWSCVPAPRTIYRDVRKVRPGHLLRFDATGRMIADEPYWSAVDVANGVVQDAPRGEEAVDELAEILGRAVGSRMEADVPLGAFLSGGIDSSAVVSMMVGRSSRPVQTFTIGFSEPAYDESPHAKAVATHLGTDHHELIVTPEDAREIIPLLPTMYDEPFADSSQIPTFLLSRMTRRNVTVALSGDGGDELFGGYDRYRHLDRIRRMHRRVPSPARRLVAAGLAGISSGSWDRLGEGPFGRLGPPSMRRRLGHRVHKAARVLTAGGVEAVYLAMMSAENDAGAVALGTTGGFDGSPDLSAGVGDRTAFEQAMLMDTRSYLPDDLLTKVDRASMAVSLEVRAPMLDPTLFGFAWRLHGDDRVRAGNGKWVLRGLVHRHVPAELVDRPKMGFGIPVGDWLRGPLRGWVEDLLDPTLLAEQGHLDPEAVSARWTAHLDGRTDLILQLWPILMFQAWWNQSR